MSIADQTWIGDLPVGWSLTRLDRVLLERKEINKNREETNILSVTNDRGVINYADKGNIGNKASDDIERYKKVHKGDIVANSMNVIIGSVGIAPEDGALSPVYIVMQPAKDIDVRYYDYIFKAKGFQAQLKRIGYGILAHRMRIPWGNLKVQTLPKPSRETQARIADYLDEETALIDDLIAKQQRLLELLEEKRRATITHAVTRGLNPNAELKDTGIKWLGKIPVRWQLRPIKAFAQINNGSDYKDIEAYDGEGYPVIGSGGEFARATKFVYDGKSVLLGRKGTIDKPMYIEGKFWTVDTMFWTKIDEDKIVPKYLYYSALSIPYDYYQTKTALPSMTQSNLLNHQIAVPDIKEQVAIVDYLDDYQTNLESLKAKINKQIDLLKERRTSLISSAVTGKVKV